MSQKTSVLGTYVEVGAESAVDDRRLGLVGEEEHLGLAWVVIFEDVVVLARDLDDTIANVLESHLL